MPVLKNSLKILNARFTQIPNELINCQSLSQAAKGVYCYLASKPEGWKFVMDEIQSHFPKPIKAAVQELEEARWLYRQTEPIKGKGMGFEWAWYIAITPFTNEDIAEITTTRDFNYDSKTTMIVKSGGYNNTEYRLSNTESPSIVPPRGPSDGQSESDSDRTVREAVEQFEQRWNSELCKDCPFIARIIAFNDSRKKQVKARLKEAMKIRDRLKLDKPLLDFVFDDIIRYRCSNSDFLQGKVEPVPGRSKFRFSIDHFCRPSFFANLVDGKYTS